MTTTDISLALLLGPQLRVYRAAGYDVIGVSAPGPHVEELRSWGIEHRALEHATRSTAPIRDVRAFAELISLLREIGPDIVHTHNPKPGIYGRVAAKMARVPVIVNTVHGLYALPEDRFAKRAVVYGLERVASTCSDLELVQNPEDVATLAQLHIPRRKIRLLGNGVDLERFRPTRISAIRRDALRAEMRAGDDDIVCGAVGRLVWEKGYRDLFDAAEQLRTVDPRLRFVVIGDEDAEKADGLRKRDVERAERNGITFLGMRSDVPDLYNAMDIYVLASHREGFPRSAMEAAASGLPLVLTDIRGCRQVVDDGVNGFLVPPRDPEALSAAIMKLASDKDLRSRFASASITKAIREFDERRVCEVTLNAYQELLARSSRS